MDDDVTNRVNMMIKRVDWEDKNQRDMILMLMYLLPFYQLGVGANQDPPRVDEMFEIEADPDDDPFLGRKK